MPSRQLETLCGNELSCINLDEICRQKQDGTAWPAATVAAFQLASAIETVHVRCILPSFGTYAKLDILGVSDGVTA